MSFYERYADICNSRGLDPCSQRMAETIGITRATISSWNKNGNIPKGEIVTAVADALGVSSDYLLERTDDPTDYTNPDLLAEISPAVLKQFNGNTKKALAFQRAVDDDAARDPRPYKPGQSTVIRLIRQLDDVDTARVEAYIQGLLAGDKYKTKEKQA